MGGCDGAANTGASNPYKAASHQTACQKSATTVALYTPISRSSPQDQHGRGTQSQTILPGLVTNVVSFRHLVTKSPIASLQSINTVKTRCAVAVVHGGHTIWRSWMTLSFHQSCRR